MSALLRGDRSFFNRFGSKGSRTFLLSRKDVNMDLHYPRKKKQDNLNCALFNLSILIFLLAVACATHSQSRPFDHQTCLDAIPDKVKDLTILAGPRTETSLIADMVPAVCYSRILAEKHRADGKKPFKGIVTYQIQVEYTGEVVRVDVVDTTIQSQQFVRKVIDFIMDTDFVGWVRNDVDTVFNYPMTF